MIGENYNNNKKTHQKNPRGKSSRNLIEESIVRNWWIGTAVFFYYRKKHLVWGAGTKLMFTPN